ncbi:MAG: type II toxin-antitoxin system VapC family toxin [Chloroflexota bacterium]|nr:type II toxin-antitoxin system VapC family toxin [Chloroflexota bacterium]
MRRSSPTCVDASLVVRFVSVREDEGVRVWWERWSQEPTELVAPMLIRYEVTNALHRLKQAGEASEGATQEALRSALVLPIRLYHDENLHGAALDFAARFSLPAAYDAHYLALADRLGAEFWTTDRRLANSVRPALPWVRLVGEETAER